MWSCASNVMTRCLNSKNNLLNLNTSECSDDEASYDTSREEGLECPICWESFNLVENVPYVLWCGHTLCKHCVLGLPWAALKFPTLPFQLPFFVSCPWCNLLSPRVMYKGVLRFPRKNFFILWMVESMNGERAKSYTSTSQGNIMNHREAQPTWVSHQPNLDNNGSRQQWYFNRERLNLSIRKSLAFFINLTAKFPLVIMFLLVTLYAIPASAAILALYILITVIFALPSFLVLYFAYPVLDWLIREIMT